MSKCKDCYFYGKCYLDEECDDFTPISDDLSEEELEDLRQEYYEAWVEYISENE